MMKDVWWSISNVVFLNLTHSYSRRQYWQQAARGMYMQIFDEICIIYLSFPNVIYLSSLKDVSLFISYISS